MYRFVHAGFGRQTVYKHLVPYCSDVFTSNMVVT